MLDVESERIITAFRRILLGASLSLTIHPTCIRARECGPVEILGREFNRMLRTRYLLVIVLMNGIVGAAFAAITLEVLPDATTPAPGAVINGSGNVVNELNVTFDDRIGANHLLLELTSGSIVGTPLEENPFSPQPHIFENDNLSLITIGGRTFFENTSVAPVGATSHFGPRGDPLTEAGGDLNADGYADGFDLNLVYFNIGQTGDSLPPEWTQWRPADNEEVRFKTGNVPFHWTASWIEFSENRLDIVWSTVPPLPTSGGSGFLVAQIVLTPNAEGTWSISAHPVTESMRLFTAGRYVIWSPLAWAKSATGNYRSASTVISTLMVPWMAGT